MFASIVIAGSCWYFISVLLLRTYFFYFIYGLGFHWFFFRSLLRSVATGLAVSPAPPLRGAAIPSSPVRAFRAHFVFPSRCLGGVRLLPPRHPGAAVLLLRHAALVRPSLGLCFLPPCATHRVWCSICAAVEGDDYGSWLQHELVWAGLTWIWPSRMTPKPNPI